MVISVSSADTIPPAVITWQIRANEPLGREKCFFIGVETEERIVTGTTTLFFDISKVGTEPFVRPPRHKPDNSERSGSAETPLAFRAVLWYNWLQIYLNTRGIIMTLENALDRGIANVEIEGFTVDEQMREWCKKLLKKEITYEEYLALLRDKARKSALSEEGAHAV